MRKILAFIGIVFLVGLLFVPLVSASTNIPSQFITGCTSAVSVSVVHPSGAAGLSAVGEAFTADMDSYVNNVKFYLAKTGSPTGFMRAVIYELNPATTAGTDGLPSSTEVCASDYVDSSTLAGSFVTTTFTFLGSEQLTGGTSYVVVLELYNATFTGSNYVKAAYRPSNYNSTMNYVSYGSGAWSYNVGRELYYIINGNTVSSGATPTPTPVPTSAPSGSGDATLEYWGGIVATWIFPILLVLVPAVIAAYYLGKIGFIIGLNIGMILGYAALPNIFGLWTVVMLVLVDIGYFFFARG